MYVVLYVWLELNVCVKSFKVYKENVITKLDAARDYLATIHPLRFRVELLENIFSMLFLTNEDICEHSNVHSDSGDEGAVDSRTHSRNASHSSANSFALKENSGLVTADGAGHFLSISDENVMLWSDKTSSTANTSVETVTGRATVQTKDPLLSRVEQYPKKEVSGQRESFAIHKVGLKDEASSIVVDPRRTSGNTSVTSAASNTSTYKVGFLVNEYIVRDILHLLKESLGELNSTRFKLTNSGRDSPTEASIISMNERREMEPLLDKCIASDVPAEKLPQRISKLQQCVSEATWRFQLASHDWLPAEVGEIAVDPAKIKDGEIYWGKDVQASFSSFI